MKDYDSDRKRLPIYLVLDCFSSMSGDAIEAVRQGLQSLLSELKGNPQAIETVFLSIITFDSDARQVVPLTEVMTVQEPRLEPSGASALGAGLSLLSSCIEKEVRKPTADQKGDWRPVVFLMTLSEPTDSWEKPADAIRRSRFGTFVALGNEANKDVLKAITDIVIRLNHFPYVVELLVRDFEWMRRAARPATANVAAKPYSPAIPLPPLPPDIPIVP